MALGRKTGGRAKGTPNKTASAEKEIRARLEGGGLLPLEYLLAVMRDPAASTELRMAAAKSAAPYVHRALKSVEHSGAEGGPIEYEITLSFDDSGPGRPAR